MKFKIVIHLSLLFMSLSVFSQEKFDDSYYKIKSIFEEKETGSKYTHKTIPKDIAEKALGYVHYW